MVSHRRTVLALPLFLLAACTNVKVRPEEKLVFQYAEGIQSSHQSTYENSFLPCHPDWEDKSLKARLAHYEETRRKGQVSFTEDGIEIIKLAALGRGAYFKLGPVTRANDALEFTTLLKPDYLSINYSEFPPGAILYILGAPLGTVLQVRPGKQVGPQREVVDTLSLRWRWTRLGGGTSESWCLESVLPVRGTETFRKLEFRESAPPPSPPTAEKM